MHTEVPESPPQVSRVSARRGSTWLVGTQWAAPTVQHLASPRVSGSKPAIGVFEHGLKITVGVARSTPPVPFGDPSPKAPLEDPAHADTVSEQSASQSGLMMILLE